MGKKSTFLPIEVEESIYVDSLQYYLENDCVNIGLIGDYSTGKSSIVTTYKNKTNSEIITLSTATFYNEVENESPSDLTTKVTTDLSENITDDIVNDKGHTDNKTSHIDKKKSLNKKYSEKEIIKVFIHHLHNMLEEDTYISTKLSISKSLTQNKIRIFSICLTISILGLTFPMEVNRSIIFLLLTILIFSFSSISFIIFYSTLFELIISVFPESFKYYTNFIETVKLTSNELYLFLDRISHFIMFAILAFTIYCVITYAIKFMQISKIDKKGISFNTENSLESSTSIIEREMHILVTLFKEIYENRKCSSSKMLVVVFEDIDRFNNELIFDFLYRLTQNLKHTKMNIKFIFAIRPDMISGDVTKFFDAVIDVVPHYHILNAPNRFLLEAEEQIPGIKISKKLLNNTVVFLPNIRDAKRVINYLDDLCQIHKNSSQSTKEMLFEINYDRLYSIAFLNVFIPNELSLTNEIGSNSMSKTQELIKIIGAISKENVMTFAEAYSAIADLKTEDELINSDLKISEELAVKYLFIIVSINPRLLILIDYLFKNNYLDEEYKRLISPNYSVYSNENDQVFALNFINRRGILNNGIFQLTNPNIIDNELLELNSLESFRELINIDLFKYYEVNNKLEHINKLLKNFDKNNKLDLLCDNLEDFRDETIEVMIKYFTKKQDLIFNEEIYITLFNEFDSRTFSSKDNCRRFFFILLAYAEKYTLAIDITKEKVKVLPKLKISSLENQVGELNVAPSILNFDKDAISDALNNSYIDNNIVFYDLCERQKSELECITEANLGEMLSFISEELVSTSRLEILNNIFIPSFKFNFESLKYFTYPEICELLKNNQVTLSITNIIQFYEGIEFEKSGKLVFEDVVDSIDEEYIIAAMSDLSNDKVKALISEYVLFNKLTSETNIYKELNKLSVKLDADNLIQISLPTDEKVIKLFEFDFQVMKEIYNQNEELAIKYCSNFDKSTLELEKFEDGEFFVKLLKHKEIDQLLLELIRKIKFEEKITINIEGVSKVVVMQLINKKNRSAYYSIEFYSLINWINAYSGKAKSIKKIIEFSCTYKRDENNSVIINCLKWNNKDIFNIVHQKIKNKFDSKSLYIDYISVNLDNIENLSELVFDSIIANDFNFLKVFIKSSKTKENLKQDFISDHKKRNILKKLCVDYNLKLTAKQIKKV